jgi:hypothetical protein
MLRHAVSACNVHKLHVGFGRPRKMKPGGIMPFKSQAQRRKFAELLVKGEISPATFEEWNRETGSAKLPERAARKKPKKAAAKKSAAKKKKTAKKRTTTKKRTAPRKRTTARKSARKSTRKSARKSSR